ncbi:MAG: hypothetical protein GKS07_11040 [Nitrosopumilus sp.]|nr:MAG: hypothetical protein GKS07_00605 [Nitrosopumilus sp.]QMU55377.1 MAG: hypothetical protein GKS07_11040 [Nitrosopumilus sp.]
MADSKNWSYVQTPKIVFQEIEKILEGAKFKRLGYFKPKDIAILLFRDFLTNPDGFIENQLDIRKHELKLQTKSKIEFIGTIGNRIVLDDSSEGTISVIIDEDKKLQCYVGDTDPHDNKWVRFCLKNDETWDFLKASGVKVVKTRNDDKDEE